MIAIERNVALGSRSTISRWAAISPSPKSHCSTRHRVRRPLNYPAPVGLDRPISRMGTSVGDAWTERFMRSFLVGSVWVVFRVHEGRSKGPLSVHLDHIPGLVQAKVGHC